MFYFSSYLPLNEFLSKYLCTPNIEVTVWSWGMWMELGVWNCEWDLPSVLMAIFSPSFIYLSVTTSVTISKSW